MFTIYSEKKFGEKISLEIYEGSSAITHQLNDILAFLCVYSSDFSKFQNGLHLRVYNWFKLFETDSSFRHVRIVLSIFRLGGVIFKFYHNV